MARVTASELQKNFGKFQAQAQREAVIVTSHGRDSVVLIGTEDYNRLKKLEDEMTDKMMDERIAVHRDTLLDLAK
jgi:prevent-host-death family protein